MIVSRVGLPAELLSDELGNVVPLNVHTFHLKWKTSCSGHLNCLVLWGTVEICILEGHMLRVKGEKIVLREWVLYL
jgi:hypothetical protein